MQPPAPPGHAARTASTAQPARPAQIDFDDFKHVFLQPPEGEGSKHRLETGSDALRAAMSHSLKKRSEGSSGSVPSNTMRGFLKGEGLHAPAVYSPGQ